MEFASYLEAIREHVRLSMAGDHSPRYIDVTGVVGDEEVTA